MDGSLITTGLILAAGCGLFLRLVAKEKHRREKHLQMRLEEKIQEQEERAKAQAAEAEGQAEDGEPVATLQEVGSGLEAA